MSYIPSALTIAGTDPTGGAGIQADLKTFQECQAYGMSVVTSVVAQNTEGVQDVTHIPVEMIDKQLTAVLEDIRPHAVKTGMIATTEMIEVITERLQKESLPLVVDPVMVATSGHALIEKRTQQVLKERLLPLATIVTPNLQEAELLIDDRIQTLDDAEQAAKYIVNEYGASACIVKGGHLDEAEAVDILYTGSKTEVFRSPRTKTKHTHGTGCTFSAAIAAYLARGADLTDAVEKAKAFITAAIATPLELGKGNGPTNHWGSRLEIEDIRRENNDE